MPRSWSVLAVVLLLRVPVGARGLGLVAVERVDEVGVLLADVGEAGVVGGRVGGERPVVDVGHCGEGCSLSPRSGSRGLKSAVSSYRSITWSDPVPFILPEALQAVHAALQPIGHHAQFHRTVTGLCNREHPDILPTKHLKNMSKLMSTDRFFCPHIGTLFALNRESRWTHLLLMDLPG